MSIRESLMKAAEEDARRAGERNRLLGDALRVRAGNSRRSGPRVAAAMTHLALQVARYARSQLSHVLAAGHSLPGMRPDLYVPTPGGTVGPGPQIGGRVLEAVPGIPNGTAAAPDLPPAMAGHLGSMAGSGEKMTAASPPWPRR
jgi:hypothetical protein